MAQTLPPKDRLVPIGVNLSEAVTDTDAPELPPKERLVPIQKASWSEQMGARFASTKSFANNLTIMAESYMPLGNIYDSEEGFGYYSPEELYGKEFMDMSYDQRREYLTDLRNKQLAEEFADVEASNKVYGEDTSANVIGTIGGVLADPTVAIGGSMTTLPKILGFSGAFGGAYSAAEQEVETGEVDAGLVGRDAVLAAAVSVIPVVGYRTAKKFIGKSKPTKTLSEVEEANTVIDKLEAGYANGINNKVPKKDLYEHAKNTAGLTEEQVRAAKTKSGRKPRKINPGEAKVIQAVIEEGTDATARQKYPVLDAFISSTSRVIGKIAPELKTKLRALDMTESIMLRNKMLVVDPFKKAYKSLSDPSKRMFKRHVLNGDFKAAKTIMSSASKAGGQAFDDVADMFKKSYDQLTEGVNSFNIPRVENYFHRSVKDYDGLYKYLTGKDRTAVEKIIAARQKRSKSPLSDDEKANIINNYLRGYNVIGQGAGWSKARTINRLTDDMLDFYDDPVESVIKYARSSSRNIARKQFFGKQVSTSGSSIDTIDSIENIIASQGSLIGAKELDTLRSALQARFVTGERSGSGLMEGLRQVGYISTLPNPLSVMTQIGDMALSVRINGMANTIKALLGPKSTSVKDFALDRVAAEFTDAGPLVKAVDALFKYSGFSAVDRLGKNTFLNASLKKGAKLAKTEKGRAKLRKKYGNAFEDFDAVMDDLAKGNITEDTKLYLWNELADIQPIGLSEYPQKYLSAPNGRIFYSLKSYTLKQLDYMRETIIDEAAKGNVGTALKNAAAYALIIPPANMAIDAAKDVVQQRPVDFEEELGDRIVSNIWKTFGASTYLMDKLGTTGKITEAGKNLLLPPLDYLDHVGGTLVNLASGEDLDPKAMQSIPIAGRLMYNFMGGGLEKYEERRRDKILSGE